MMTCITTAFSTFLLLSYGAVLMAKWVTKTLKTALQNIKGSNYGVHDRNEPGYQRVKASVLRDQSETWNKRSNIEVN